MQIAIAIAIGGSILAATLWVVKMLLILQPDDPDQIREIAVDYRGIVWGMRLTITHAQDESPEAPRHCREDMIEVS